MLFNCRVQFGVCGIPSWTKLLLAVGMVMQFFIMMSRKVTGKIGANSFTAFIIQCIKYTFYHQIQRHPLCIMQIPILLCKKKTWINFIFKHNTILKWKMWNEQFSAYTMHSITRVAGEGLGVVKMSVSAMEKCSPSVYIHSHEK